MRDDLQPNNGEINGSKHNGDINTAQEYMDDQTENFEISGFHFNEEMIGKLKKRSGALSSFVAVSAHFWRCVTRAREVPEKEVVDFGVIANSKGRVKLALPQTYLGTAYAWAFPELE